MFKQCFDRDSLECQERVSERDREGNGQEEERKKRRGRKEIQSKNENPLSDCQLALCVLGTPSALHQAFYNSALVFTSWLHWNYLSTSYESLGKVWGLFWECILPWVYVWLSEFPTMRGCFWMLLCPKENLCPAFGTVLFASIVIFCVSWWFCVPYGGFWGMSTSSALSEFWIRWCKDGHLLSVFQAPTDRWGQISKSVCSVYSVMIDYLSELWN